MIFYANVHIQSESSSGLGRSVFLGAGLRATGVSWSWTASSLLSSSLLSDSLSLQSLSESGISVGGALDPAEASISGLKGWNWTLPIASLISSPSAYRRTFCHPALLKGHWRLWLFAEHVTDVPCRDITLLTLLARCDLSGCNLTWSPLARYLPHGSKSNKSL